jgi:hypothetical protein
VHLSSPTPVKADDAEIQRLKIANLRLLVENANMEALLQ